MVKLLLENKSPVNATDISGLTALHHGEYCSAFTTLFVLRDHVCSYIIAISEGHGDTAMVLLKAGAETDTRDVDDNLAINLAPDKKAISNQATPYPVLSAHIIRRFEISYCEAQSEKVSIYRSHKFSVLHDEYLLGKDQETCLLLVSYRFRALYWYTTV